MSSDTLTVGKASLPFTLVNASVSPFHMTLPFSHVFTKPSSIKITIHPLKLTHSILSIGTKMPLKLISVFADPSPLSLPKASLELALISSASFPNILSFAMRASLMIIALILVSILKNLDSIAFLDKLAEIS